MGVNSFSSNLNISRNEIFLNKISNLIDACNCLDNLQILIYLPEDERIIYTNAALDKIVGLNSAKFLEDGWNLWFSLINEDELEFVKTGINDFFSTPCFQDPFVLKYHILNNGGIKQYLRHEIVLYCIENKILAINYFFDITEKEKIDKYLYIANNYNVEHSENKVAVISPREKEVLKLVADGFSSKQIAEKLFISSHTAISHRKNLIEKFNVKNTAQLIKRASRSIAFW